MKKKKVILLGGLVLILTLSVYAIVWAALDVGNDLNMTPIDKGPFEILKLKNPSAPDSAATWGYVKDAVNGNPSLVLDQDIGIWRQDGTSHDVYLNPLMEPGLSGNVGIGTNDPEYLLDLQGTGIQTLSIKSTSTSGDRGAVIYLGDSGDDANGELWKIGSTGDDKGKALSFSTCTFSTCQDIPVVYMTTDGKVGIGTSSPQYALDVRGSGIQTLRVSSTSTSDNRGAELFLGDANNNTYWQIFSTGTDIAKPLDFQFCSSDLCQDASLVRFTTDGEIGLGTIDPQEKLHVRGNTWINNDLLVGRFVGVTECSALNEYPPTRGIRIGDDSYIYDDNCDDGYGGSSVPHSVETLYIVSGDSIAIKAGAHDESNGSLGVYVAINGNVGIGTTNPAGNKLFVPSGGNNVRFGDDLVVGGIVTSHELQVDSDASVSGALIVDGNIRTASTMQVSGTCSESCDSSSVGMMRYCEESDMSKFQICMRNGSDKYGWFTIKSYDWVEG